MRIGFDVTPLSVTRAGVGSYTLELFNALHRTRRPNEKYVSLTHRPVDKMQRMNKTLWMQTALRSELTEQQVEVAHYTNSVAPLWSDVPSVLTIHDMTLWLFPECHPAKRLLAMRPIIPLAAHQAKAIIAVSERVRQDIISILGLPPEKVHVIHEAPSAHFTELSAKDPMLEATRQLYSLPEKFILSVGTLEPRKNLVRLLKAFASLYHSGAVEHKLVMVGGKGWKYSDVFKAVEELELQQAVIFPGYVPDDALVAMYNLADALVFPSLYEGFGLPVVEAMACGTPVITSQAGSLPEVGGNAAAYVDPLKVESISDAIMRVLCDEYYANDLRERGKQHVRRFTWEATAQETRRVYDRVLNPAEVHSMVAVRSEGIM